MNKENLKKKVYDHIMEAIIQGEYSPDDILSESMLTEKYNVSKSPVRGAGPAMQRKCPKEHTQVRIHGGQDHQKRY